MSDNRFGRRMAQHPEQLRNIEIAPATTRIRQGTTTRMASFQKLNTDPTYRRLYDAIETEIVRGRLKPRSKLPTEMSLSEQFGVNRSTVREAIRLLEQTGLVQRKTSRRLEVSLPSTDHLAEGIRRALLMQGVTFLELWSAMVTVEPALSEAAALVITPEQIAALEANLEEAKAAHKNPKLVAELDVKFHSIIADAAGNRVLQLSREPISLLFYPLVKKVITQLSQAAGRNVEAHEGLVAAFKARDAAEARRWMIRHINDFRRGYEHAGFDLHAPVDVPR
jgi:GntR family transcriptional regulator, transcriptional repressor for pyruvate dehydrogenase complex